MREHRPMRVWANRVPADLVDAWTARAEAEGVSAAAMLRHVMADALASPDRIMPLPAPPPEAPVPVDDCGHPPARRFAFSAERIICRACGAFL
jgi:hypothetical protein